MAILSALLAALTDPSSQDGYDQGAAQGVNPQTALGAAMTAGQLAPMAYGSQSAMPTSAQQSNTAAAAAQLAAPGTNLAPYGYGGGTPVAQAMAPQAPQAPATPVAQAMDPQAPQDPSTMGQAGMPQMSPIQQMLYNQANNPNQAIGNGMLQAGGAMLAGKTFGEGMGNAAQAFGTTFNQTLDNQRKLNTPQVIPLADGAFSQVQMPGEAPQIVPNSQVQDFMMGKMVRQAQIARAQQTAGKQDQAELATMKLDQQNGVAAQNSLMTLQQSQQGLNAAQTLTDQLKKDPNRSLALKGFSALPAVVQSTAASGVMGPAMAQAAADHQTLSNAAIDGMKWEMSGVTGSMSDEGMKKALGAVPSPSADPSLWDQYYSRAGSLIGSRTDFYKQLAQRGQDAGQRLINPGGDVGRPSIQVPGTPGTQAAPQASGAPPQVTDAASYNAIPSGALYQLPNGTYRRKS